MRVLLDPEIFFLQKFGGISRYCAEIIDNLSNIDDVDLICPIYYSENLHLRNNKFWNVVKQILPQRIKNFLIQKSKEKFSQILQSDAFDVVVSSYYSKALLSYSGNKPLVLTVYAGKAATDYVYPPIDIGGEFAFSASQGAEGLKDLITPIKKSNVVDKDGNPAAPDDPRYPEYLEDLRKKQRNSVDAAKKMFKNATSETSNRPRESPFTTQQGHAYRFRP